MSERYDAESARFDESLLVELLDDDAAVLRTLFDLYIESCSRCTSDVEAALLAADLDAVFASAHRLKASSHQIGALALSRVAGQIEELSRRPNPSALQKLPPLVARCRSEADAAERWIRARRSRLPA